jgi:outer membrane biosynthesis protein TonB
MPEPERRKTDGMSELMNTVRATRRLLPASPRLPGDVDRLAVLALLALCAALFIGFFALARALRTTSHASSGSPPAVIATPTGNEVPLRLTAAPAMQAGARVAPAPAVRSAPPRRSSASAQTPTTSTTAAAVPTTAAPAPTPQPTSAAPVAAREPAKAPPAAKAPAPAKAPETRRAPAPTKPSGGGGTSFDSSG